MKLKNTNVMLDVETLGTKPGAVILSIGAVVFGEGVGDRDFYRLVNVRSCVDAGLVLDVDTVLWWMEQNAAARRDVVGSVRWGVSLRVALEDLAAFMGPDAVVWGNSAAFDNAIVRAAYEALGMECPWKFWNERCYRTMKALFPAVEMVRGGTHHNARDDARSQAEHLMRILEKL